MQLNDSCRRLIGVVTSLVMVVGAWSTNAAAETPGEFVSGLGKRVVKVLDSTEGNMTERREQLKALFLEGFDVEFIGRFVVGRFWNKASEAERQEFMGIMPEYVATIYASLFSGYEGDGFKVVREEDIDEGYLVDGIISRDNGPNVAAAFTVTDPNGAYLIKNATVEGVSLLVTKRSEFASVLAREGMSGLIERIKKVLAG